MHKVLVNRLHALMRTFNFSLGVADDLVPRGPIHSGNSSQVSQCKESQDVTSEVR